MKKIADENYITLPSSVNKPQLLQLGAQEYTCELILGDNVDLPKFDVIEPLQSLVVTCYKGKYCPSNVTTIPQIRWHLHSKLKCEFNKLPPTQAALQYKIFRSHYVTLVLRRAYLAITNLPFPLGHGWETKDDVYELIMKDELPVPTELMELSVCGCKTSRTMRCKCIKNHLMCTDLCKCVSCKNDGTLFDVTVHDDSSEDQL